MMTTPFVSINKHDCIGCETCCSIISQVFEFDNMYGKCVTRKLSKLTYDKYYEKIKFAAESCPNECIKYIKKDS